MGRAFWTFKFQWTLFGNHPSLRFILIAIKKSDYLVFEDRNLRMELCVVSKIGSYNESPSIVITNTKFLWKKIVN